MKRSKSGHLSDGKIKRGSSRKRVRDLVTEVENDKKIVKGGSIVELVNSFAKKDIKGKPRNIDVHNIFNRIFRF